jgi:membrane protease YdiL (CAAX protease family)
MPDAYSGRAWHRASGIAGRQLHWFDAAAGLVLAVLWTVAIGGAVRAHWLPGIVATYAGHAWLAGIALVWYFWFGRRFPIGGISRSELLPWVPLWLLAIIGNALVAFSSPPTAVTLPAASLLVADLVFLALVVGPTEELLFRGLVQTGFNGSVPGELRLRGWSLRGGTVLAAFAFGLWHLVNLTYQPIGPTMSQVLIATIVGLVIGVVYDRTCNLIGAAVLHGLIDLMGTALPLVAYEVLHR